MMRSRIATAAVAASLVAGLAACSTTSKGASGGAPTATGTTAPSATASTSSGAPATTATASATSAAFAAGQLETMRSKVAAVFGQGFTAASAHLYQPTPDPTELAADFDSQATMKAVWGTGTGTAPSDRPMDCGMAKYNGVAIGAVQASGSTATVPVVLYQGEKAGSSEITVTVDPTSGVVKGVTCGGAPNAADFPGIAPIATYYGATASLDESVLNDKTKSFFTPTFDAWQSPGANYNVRTCTQDVPDSWVVALTGTTSSASSWDFAPRPFKTVADPKVPGGPVGFTASMAVDLGSAGALESAEISRVTCQANPPAADSAHPAQYAETLMNYYRSAAEQTSLGVDAEAAIRPFFVSDSAFTTAWGNTGTVPLLCAKKVSGAVQLANGTTPTTSGSLMTLSMVTWPSWHPDAPGQEASKFTLVLDTSTMKISAITCTK